MTTPEPRPNVNLLLSSAGPTTEPIREHMKALFRDTAQPTIIRITDGWNQFDPLSGVPMLKRAEHRADSMLASAWSAHYMHTVLGRDFRLIDVNLRSSGRSRVVNWLKWSDGILLPGGNTHQLRAALQPYDSDIVKAVDGGLPLIAESAGSIVAGKDVSPAFLPPADTAPSDAAPTDPGLSLLDAHIVVHARGEKRRPIDMSGRWARAAATVLRLYSTPTEDVASYVTEHEQAGANVYVLNDAAALAVTGSEVSYL